MPKNRYYLPFRVIALFMGFFSIPLHLSMHKRHHKYLNVISNLTKQRCRWHTRQTSMLAANQDAHNFLSSCRCRLYDIFCDTGVTQRNEKSIVLCKSEKGENALPISIYGRFMDYVIHFVKY